MTTINENRSVAADLGHLSLVGAPPRTAEPVLGSAWCGASAARRSQRPESPRLRRTVVEHYTRAGLLEHASVASFARFVLQLVAVGAPPDLVLDAQHAMRDEVRHAQLFFSIARSYGGHAMGPGPLPVDGALSGRHDLVSVARSVIRHGCVGETLAAVEVEEAASWARDAELATTLARIAEDELSHARLAWRTVAWALRRADAHTRGLLSEAFWEAIADARAATAHSPAGRSVDPVELRAHGVLSPDDRLAIRRRTLDAMVEPCAAALLTPGASGRSVQSRLA